LLGHRILLTSTPGKGSVFAVEVEMLAAGSGGLATSAAIPAAPAVDPRDRIAGAEILVIEDDPAVRSSLRLLLQGWGARVATAESLADALAVVGAMDREPQELLVDYGLAGEATGTRVVREIRELFYSKAEAVILTAMLDQAVQRRIEAQGLHVLQKPVHPAKLRALLGDLASRQSRPPAISPHASP
jgi:CheY-like chemotaxis protein